MITGSGLGVLLLFCAAGLLLCLLRLASPFVFAFLSLPAAFAACSRFEARVAVAMAQPL